MINLSNTTPAAPAGGTNVLWQSDSSGNVSAYSAILKQTVAPVSGVLTIDASTGTSFLVNVNAAITFMSIINPTDGEQITLLFQQDSVGHTVVLASNLIGATAVSTTANSTTCEQFTYNAPTSAWYATAAGGSGGFVNPMTATGDLIVGGASGAATRLPIGTSGQTLTSNGSTGFWQTGSVTVRHIFPAAGTYNYVHNLSDLTPGVTVYVNSGATAYSMVPVDANTTAITVNGASDITATFIKTANLPLDFSITDAPNTLNYVPSMSGTQTTPAIVITQDALNGYTGAVNYSANGLASGMTDAFAPTSITTAGSTDLTLSFPATQPAGTTTFTVTGSDGTISHTLNPSVTISDINQGLLDGWEMNEGSGTTFFDATSNANNETFASSIGTWGAVSGFPGTAFTFNGTGTAIGSKNTLTNFDGTASFSASAWTKLSGTAAFDRIVSGLGPSYGWLLQSSPYGGFQAFLASSGGPNTPIEYDTVNIYGTLHFLVMVYTAPLSGGSLQIYLDGSLVGTTAVAMTGSLVSGVDVSLGGPGTVGYVRIYNRILSATDVSAMYAAGPR